MATKKIEWQREIFTDIQGIDRQLFGCPLPDLDEFASLMFMFNQHVEASDDEATIEQLYEGNEHFKEIVGKLLTMCNIDLAAVNYSSIAELLHSYLQESEGAFYPGRLIQVNFPFSKKYRFSPFEQLESELAPDLIDIVEELTDAVELIEELEKANGRSSNDNI